MEGCPAKGSSVSVVNISIFMGPSSGFPSCINTVSDKLNSRAIACLCVCDRTFFKSLGTFTIAKGLPKNGVEVKTSRVVKCNFEREDMMKMFMFVLYAYTTLSR